MIILVKVLTAKRSFSKLKWLKSYLRSTVLQNRLNKLAILSIESKNLANHKTLINDFTTQKARKIVCTLH